MWEKIDEETDRMMVPGACPWRKKAAVLFRRFELLIITRGENMNIRDPKIDDAIREALKDADKKGKLGVVAAVTGIAGGTDKLREIMNSTGELPIMDRGMLGIHLAL